MSAYGTIGEAAIIEARASFPRIGAWTAEVRVDSNKTFSGSQVLRLGNSSFRGTVTSASVHKAAAWLRVVGGAGRLGTALPARGYTSSPLLVPLQDIAREAGEVLSPSADATVTRTLLAHWARFSGSAGKCLGTLVENVEGATWRFLPSGQLWVGIETWPSVSPEVELTEYEPLGDAIVFFSLAPGILPGTTFLGRRVSYVEHRVTGIRITSTVWFEKDTA